MHGETVKSDVWNTIKFESIISLSQWSKLDTVRFHYKAKESVDKLIIIKNFYLNNCVIFNAFYWQK